MVDFTSIQLQVNVNTNASPSWQDQIGTNKELRFLDVSTGGLTTPSASWPYVTRPSTTQGVDYVYAYSADAVGLGVLGAGGAPTAFDRTKYLWGRWHWDNTGTFASAMVITCYASTAHAAITRGDGSILGGHATDTSATARSYIKCVIFGRVGSAGAPAAAPGADPLVTDGATGAVSPTAGANWSAWQGLQGDNDWLASIFTPAPTTADDLYEIMRMFDGPNETPGILLPVHSMKYTFS